jgi:hypothetical protein
MTAGKKETEAIVTFLEEMKHSRQMRRRLFERAEENPDAVLLYLDSLPPGTEAGDELLQRLRKAASAARDGSDGA